jgi:hypothetical protein
MSTIRGPRVAAAGPIPREVSQLERAPEGLKRFKVHGHVGAFAHSPDMYVLARNEAEAREFYVKAQGLADPADRRAAKSGEPPDPDIVHLKQLDD